MKTVIESDATTCSSYTITGSRKVHIECDHCIAEATVFTDTSPVKFKHIQAYAYCDLHYYKDFMPNIEVEITKEDYLARLAMEAL